MEPFCGLVCPQHATYNHGDSGPSTEQHKRILIPYIHHPSRLQVKEYPRQISYPFHAQTATYFPRLYSYADKHAIPLSYHVPFHLRRNDSRYIRLYELRIPPGFSAQSTLR
ncbi:hypothetical protein M413DRAFT_326900 [Hebeloma cylindrosporum]|uniref:Uncharacterized protein n=1 Tax=Hebeloma cylindrosporum TaxID=76867 RepID=A0A0C3BG39_HEBCY|nr:hypothetical protein M413DRAFT_326900 [Hebeloma cylindrosporum h7]